MVKAISADIRKMKASIGFDIELINDQELVRFFNSVGPSEQRTVMRKTVGEVTNKLASEARKNIRRFTRTDKGPRKSGRLPLIKSVRQKWNNKPAQGLLRRELTFTSGGNVRAFHAFPLEFGHEIVVRGKRTGKRARPRPFFRWSLRTIRTIAPALYNRGFEKGIQAAIKKLTKVRSVKSG